MSERYTIKDARIAFARLCDATGVLNEDECPLGITDSRREGAWRLDHEPQYGGCVVREYVASIPAGDPPTFTGESEPFGSRRRSPREFCEVVNFALRAGVEKRQWRTGWDAPDSTYTYTS